jgi:DNA processing protein
MPRKGTRYSPPRNYTATTLIELIDGAREIPINQEERLGFSKQMIGGLRLWCAGDLSLAKKRCVAIVGSRRVSTTGAARARRLARELSEAGVVVVSGLAHGVDTEALTAAIDAGGKAIAVIGTPINKAYPAANKKLQELVYREHLLVSQFKPGSRVYPTHFPQRNKLMAAISDATVIIEASDSSGTLHQAAECTRLKRWLFITHSVVDDKKLEWPKRFLKYPTTRSLTSTSDILERLKL